MKNRHLEMASRTLTDLPSELLHMLCTQLARCSTDIRRFSCVCRRVRAVALEYLNFRRMCVRSILSFAPLVQFLRAYPRVAETVVSLQLYGAIVYNEKEYSLQPITIIDDTHVASVMEYLPNLVGLVLEYFQFANPPPTHQRECPPGPFRISWISIISNCEGRSSLTGALCVLSLFTLRSLDRLDLGRFFNTKTPFERELLHRPLDIQQLSLSSFFNGPAYLPTTLRAFTESLKDDSLQVLRIRVDTGDAVLAMGELLIHAGSNITTLEIDLSLPVTPIGRVKWVNPFRGKFSTTLHPEDMVDHHLLAPQIPGRCSTCRRVPSSSFSVSPYTSAIGNYL